MGNLPLEYQKVIDFRGKNVAVSASAGCGKTTSMINRITDIIIKEKIDVTRLLIVTFTKAAAAEMKNKLKKKLSEYPAESFAGSQLGSVEIADISTLHSFCYKICAEFFNVAEIPADFTLIEENDSLIYRAKVLKEITEECYSSGDREFLELTRIFSVKRSDEGLVRTVNKLFETIVYKPDAEEYMQNICDICYKDTSLAERLFVEDLRHFAEEYINIIENQRAYLGKLDMSANDALLENLSHSLKKIDTNKDIKANFAVLSELLEILSASVKPEKKVKENSIADCAHERTKEIKKSLKSVIKDRAEKTEIYLSGQNYGKTSTYINKLCEITKLLYQKFSDFKRENALLDYNDLEHYALKVLSNAQSRKTIADRYEYIFVDEFQDINAVQDKIISLLQKENNLFLVGDFKQSIYRFRGAENKIFKGKTENPSFEHIVLGNNFRSDRGILNFVNEVFAPVMTEQFSLHDYRKFGMLGGEGNYPLSDGRPNVIIDALKPAEKDETGFSGVYSVKKHCLSLQGKEERLDDASAEGAYIAREIKKLVGAVKVNLTDSELEKRKAEGKDEYITFGDITILVRKNKTFTEKLYNRLIKEGIPVSAEISYDIKEYFEITQILNYLKCIDNFYQDIPLLASLTGCFGKFSREEIAQMRLKYPDGGFYRCALSYAENENDALAQKLKDFITNTEFYAKLSKIMPCPRLIMKIIKDFKYEEYLLSLEGGQDYIDRVNKFLQIIYGKSYSQNLAEFLKYLEYVDGEIKLQANAGTGKVRLCTIHNSKGLEYPVVFLAGCGESFTFNDLKRQLIIDAEYGLAMDRYDLADRVKKGCFVRGVISDLQKHRQVREELNTLYVALTRAKYRLYICGSYDAEKFIPLCGVYSVKNTKRYFDYIMNIALRDKKNAPKINNNIYCANEYNLDYEFNIIDGVQAAPPQTALPQTAQRQTITPTDDYAYLSSTTQPIKNTVTVLSKGFEETDDAGEYPAAVIAEADAAETGTAYHNILSAIDFDITKDKISEFVRKCASENIISRQQADNIDIEIIWKTLNLPLISAIKRLKCYREKPFIAYVSSAEAGGDGADEVLLQGVIDLIAIGGETCHIIDYKYSNKDDGYLKNRYARQLELYALAAKQITGFEVKSKNIINIKNARVIEV